MKRHKSPHRTKKNVLDCDKKRPKLAHHKKRKKEASKCPKPKEALKNCPFKLKHKKRGCEPMFTNSFIFFE